MNLPPASAGPAYLLLQARDPSDPMGPQEIERFSTALRCPPAAIRAVSVLDTQLTATELSRYAAVLIGGSGDYSIAQGGPWLAGVLEQMRTLFACQTPVFASCFGFQALAQALGGEVVTDLSRAEVGTIEIVRTAESAQDPLFAALPERFLAHAGHQDVVVRLPEGALHLATGPRTAHQAFTFPGRPLYATQFHPELDRTALLERINQYPEYVTRLTGETLAEFKARCAETPVANGMLERFLAAFAAPR